jgi:hypothetical protein
MAEHRTQGLADIQVNTDSLYREEVYTDLNAVTLRRLLPVTAAGEPDPERDPIFLGEASIMTHLGPMPLSFPIQAASLEEACALFPQGVREAVEELDQRARENALDQSSRIVVPTVVPPELGGGGKPGGGNIIF